MPAIITSKFRYQNAANLVSAITGNGSANTQSLIDAAIAQTDPVLAESYYLFIGKSLPWTTGDSVPPLPTDCLYDESTAVENIIAMKRVATNNASHAIVRYNWVSGQSYAEYDDQDSALTNKQYYCITDDLSVYKCIKAGPAGSTVKPTGTPVELPSPGADGYQWKYMYTLSGSDVARFLTSTFISAKKLTENDDSQQWLVQQAAIDGGIHRIRITSGGTGYSATSKPTVTIVGTGTGCVVQPDDITISNGAITSILIKPENCGSGYRQATVEITGATGTGATARAIVSPPGGHGSNPVNELGAFYVIVDVQLVADDGSGDFIVDNDFRQVGLIRNPIERGTGDVANSATLSALTQLTVTGVTGAPFVRDTLIVGNTSNAKAWIVSISGSVLKVIQNTASGFKPFQANETISYSNVTSATLSTITQAEYVPGTGEIVYIENLSPVNRSISQTEDVKLVLEM